MDDSPEPDLFTGRKPDQLVAVVGLPEVEGAQLAGGFDHQDAGQDRPVREMASRPEGIRPDHVDAGDGGVFRVEVNDSIQHLHLETLRIARTDLLWPEDGVLQVDRLRFDDGLRWHRVPFYRGRYTTRDSPASSGSEARGTVRSSDEKGPVVVSTLNISYEQRATSGDEPISYTLVQLEGFIDAPNYPRFEQALERLTSSGRHHLVLDCREVEYINSTGISGIIRFHNQCVRSGGELLLARVARNVGITMHLLGVTSVVPVARDLNEAEAILSGQQVKTTDSGAGSTTAATTASGKEIRNVPVMAERPGPSGTVAMLLPKTGHFSQICKRRVEERGGRAFLYHSVEGLIEGLDAIAPDLIVVDKRVTGSHKLIEKIKLDTRHTLASMILIHPKGSDVAAIEGFRVWENDSLVDPFDLGNLFILTESEVRRVARDRKLFTQQVRFQFASQQDAIDQGLSLGGALIHKLPLTEQERNALHSALKEGVDNAVRHGNEQRPDRRVTVNYVVDPRRVMMMVEDEGDGFDHEFFLGKIEEKDAFDRAKERMREGGRGGLGILLMHRCSDRLEYLGKGNVVRIEKRLHA